ncbi:thermonuclease family protein [Microbacterium flavescens]|uniref:thermonuclease family protein n=1 Tax=Microbacterium flavescens TaxID=69366 RepID=UPI001BDEB484|nr:thermonuclease family protein [Microbacterium flavescens]
MKGFVTALAVVLGSLLVLAVGVALALWLFLSVGAFDAPAEPASSPGTEGPLASGIPPRPADAFPLTVDYVFDGDTIEARMQQPNELVTTSDAIRIRLIGIDTPEGTPTPECWADEARTHLRALLPEGATVWAAPDAETSDRYGRYLFNLWSDDGRFINHELVAAGDAEAIRVGSNDAFYDLLTDAQGQAEASGAGRWAACG